jgi:hydrogenase-4 component F
MRVEHDHGKMTPQAPAPLPQHVPDVHVHHADRADDQQPGHPVGGDGSGDADHRAAGQRLPHPASLEAAWKYFILCGVGIAQALFGTVLLYFAAERVIGAEGGALLWTNLDAVKTQLEPTIITLAFVFLLVGYGTKTGLVPLHNWLPDAHAEGPTPVSAVLSGPAAQRRAVRHHALQGAGPTARWAGRFAGNLMMGFGLLTVVVAGLLPVAAEGRQAHVRLLVDRAHGADHLRLRHGRPVANFAGLLHMTVHSLTKSAIFFAVGHATQKAGTQIMADIRGLIKVSRPSAGA